MAASKHAFLLKAPAPTPSNKGPARFFSPLANTEGAPRNERASPTTRANSLQQKTGTSGLVARAPRTTRENHQHSRQGPPAKDQRRFNACSQTTPPTRRGLIGLAKEEASRTAPDRSTKGVSPRHTALFAMRARSDRDETNAAPFDTKW
jgi:hypothetical protein